MAVKFSKPVYVFPDPFVWCMKYLGSVKVVMYACIFINFGESEVKVEHTKLDRRL